MGQGYRFVVNAASREADVYIYEDVGEGWFGGITAKQFKEDLAKIGAVDVINVHLNSYGGDVFDGLAIYRMLVESKARVVIYIDGIAASIASVIAMAGNEIRMSESGFIMIHDASGMVMGNATEMRRFADTLDTITGAIADVYAARTGEKAKQVRDWMTAETWFGAADAVEHGFADEMMPNMQAAARWNARAYAFRAPPAPVAALARRDAPALDRTAISERHARIAFEVSGSTRPLLESITAAATESVRPLPTAPATQRPRFDAVRKLVQERASRLQHHQIETRLRR